MKRSSGAVFVVAFAAACGGGNSLPTGPSPVTAEVEFRYGLADASAAEVSCDGAIRLHPSFWGFAQVTLVPVEPGIWGARFEEVPIGRHSARLETPAGCEGGELSANGVPLSRGSSATSFAGFAVATDGGVTP